MLPSAVYEVLAQVLRDAGFSVSHTRPAAIADGHVTLSPGTPFLQFVNLNRREVHRVDVTCWVPAVQPLHRLADLAYRVRVALDEAQHQCQDASPVSWLDEVQLVAITIPVLVITEAS